VSAGSANNGRLIGVGVGPGDPGLLTLKAAATISATRIIAYLSAEGSASLARTIVEAHLRPDHEERLLQAPMRAEPDIVAGFYDEAAGTIVRDLEAGRDVALLCLGDPLLYGSFVYILDRLRGRFPFEVVPGIMSFGAAASRLGRVLARRRDSFAILSSLLPEDRLEPLIAQSDAVAILKVGKRLPRLKAILAGLGRLEAAVLVTWVGWPNERIVPVADWPDDEEAPYFALILAGPGTAT
jgi:precorrin-2/cobalt-factor-2 C20-methyltransferase